MATDEFRYVLLCRHARHDDGRLVPIKDDNGVWRFPTESVARVLAEELVIGRDGLRLAKVVCAPTPEATRTANLLLQRLQGDKREADEDPPAQPSKMLNAGPVRVREPSWLPVADAVERAESGACGYDVACESWEELLPSRLCQTTSGAAKCIDQELERLGDGRNALLVVGHQPQMGWLSSHLSPDRRTRWGSGAIPLAASEVVSLRLQHAKDKWRGSLAWTLAPDDRKALDAVSDKVRGKMESAKLLSAVITLVLTALLSVVLDTSRWEGLGSATASILGLSYSGQTATQIAFVMLLAALGLYLLTMYSYDRLLMPPRFWAEGPDRTCEETTHDETRRRPLLRRLVQHRTRGAWLPKRPPSSSAWVIYRNMQRTWFWLFTPANVFVGLALAILAAPLLRLHGWAWPLIALFALVVAAWAWWFRPVLGSED